MNGAIIVNKDKWKTSFDIVHEIRKLTGIKKVGHMGTLDPLATGVLPILIGSATKAQVYINDQYKEYIATMKFGIETDTLDITGKVIFEDRTIKVDKTTFIEKMNKFKGKIKQKPPMYSAIKKNGQKLYELARRGETIDIEERYIEIFKIDLIDFSYEDQVATIKVQCSKGTYIRSLCSDIGRYLKTYAVLTDLVRIKACGYKIEEAFSIEELKELYNSNNFVDCIIKVEDLFDYRKVYISDRQCFRFKNGGSLMISRLSFDSGFNEGEILSVYNCDRFIGLGKIDIEKDELLFLKTF